MAVPSPRYCYLASNGKEAAVSNYISDVDMIPHTISKKKSAEYFFLVSYLSVPSWFALSGQVSKPQKISIHDRTTHFTDQHLLAFLVEHPELREIEALKKFARNKSAQLASPERLAVFNWLFTKRNNAE